MKYYTAIKNDLLKFLIAQEITSDVVLRKSTTQICTHNMNIFLKESKHALQSL